MKILSFIIPAYNSSPFLRKCVESMLADEILDQLEIIIVNDGSTDSTAEIAQQYCAQYPDTVRLLSQQNKGHGGALNTGCAAARGKYLKVIDADDWVQTQNLPEFLRLLEACSSDVVLTHHRTIDISTGEVKNWRSYPREFGAVMDFRDVVANWGDFQRSMTFHGITYRTAFYQAKSRPLPEHVFYEDHEYATFPCSYGQSIVCLDLFVYDYRIGDVTQSVSAGNQLKRIGHTEMIIRSMTEQYLVLPENPGKQYAALKIQGLLLSYLTTALLVEPDRKQGRAQAQMIMEACKAASEPVYLQAKRKYQVFRLMNRLGLKKQFWDLILRSRLYGWVCRKHTFS